ncbi:MAG: hypothetical protein U0804_15865 [Gemmataceae bacterium]
MILHFPDPEAVRLALTSGLVPADVTLAPAAVSTDAHGRLYVEPTPSISKTTLKVLDRLGVKGSKRHGSDDIRKVGSWVELVPLAKEAGTPEVASGAAVLFELPSADDLPAVVTELLRLGNDRQGFRWFAADGDDTRVLLRVIGPPYYTLLRALDGPAGGMRAYLERAPRVWVEFGYTHPLAAQIRVAEGQFALLTAPATWQFLDDAPFHDVYELTEFPLPNAPVAWEPAETPEPVSVPLRLTAGNSADAAELWVLRDDPVGQLDALVRDADERLTQRLMFAVAKSADGSPVAVLRTRPSKLAPPELALEKAVAFKPYWKLPNLFLPVGRRLHPQLRRDAVRRLLADDPDRVVWLYPAGVSGFTPESVPDAAFRSLEDWVDYVIEAEQASLAAWIGATRFDFEHFVCTDAGGPKPKPDKPEREPAARDNVPAPEPAAPKPRASRLKVTKSEPTAYVSPAAEAVAPNEWKLRAKELAEHFLAVEGPLDAPERTALWPQLAEAFSRAGDATSDAAVCWLNALWEHREPHPEWETAWAAAEFPQLAGRPVGAAELDAKLKGSSPSVAEPRAAVAAFLAASSRSPQPEWLAARLPAVQKYVDAHQEALPIRAVWLAASRLANLAGGDQKGLARARDRLLERLLTQGLRAERDLPGFLRFAGLRDAERMVAVREKALDLHAAARAWVGHHPPTVPYVDLFFAFALARLGESAAAKELVDAAGRMMVRPVPEDWQENKSFDAVASSVAAGVLHAAFAHRVTEAAAGRPHGGPLPPAVLDALDGIVHKGKAEMGRGAGGKTDNPFKTAELYVAKMRQVSRVADPEESREAYVVYITAYADPLRKELLTLAPLREPARLADKVRKMVREGFPGKELREVHFHLLHESLPLAGRVGEALAAELLRLVPGVLAGLAAKPTTAGEPSDVLNRQGELVERAVFAAAHFGRIDLLRPVVDGFTALLRSRPEEARYKLINIVAGAFLRGLKRLGLRDEIDRFISRLQAEVLQGATPDELRKKYAARPDSWSAALQTLLTLAGGQLTFGMLDRAVPLLDVAREELLGGAWGKNPLLTKPLGELLRAYVAALGHGPADLGLGRISELFTRFPGKNLPNVWTGSTAFSLTHVRVIEEVVWALVSDEFALGPTGKKWLDDDEYLVRKRVHADLHRAGA